MPTADTSPVVIARSRAAGREAAEQLEAPTRRLLSALERGKRRGAPEVKVRTTDLAALFTLVGFASTAAVANADARRQPWYRRLLAALRADIPDDGHHL